MDFQCHVISHHTDGYAKWENQKEMIACLSETLFLDDDDDDGDTCAL